MGYPDFAPTFRPPRGKGPRTKKKRNALRNKQLQERDAERRMRKLFAGE